MFLLIGVLGRPNRHDKKTISYSQAIIDIINRYQAIPMGIFAVNKNLDKELTFMEKKRLHQIINLCDGFILQGGWHPFPYDLEAINYINKTNKPILGICLGMQSLAIATGGIMDKVDNHKDDDAKYVHHVYINKDSNLYSILKKEKIKVNSRHLETIINPGLYKIVGMGEDNVIEALELPGKNFNIGLQWHPENMIDYDEDAKNIFDAFFKACE